MTAHPGRRLLSFITTVAWRFYTDQCLMRASALAYASLLSIVPLLAVMFAVLKGLGVQHRLEPLLLSRLSLSAETTAAVIGYIDRTNVTTLGALGAALLFVSVISLLGSIESSFNHIWRVSRSRSVRRKLTDYLAVVLLAPLLLLTAGAITSSLQVEQVLQWVLQKQYVGGAVVQGLRLVPVAINAIALGLVYAVMPYRRPHMPAVFICALAAGAAWQAVQSAYVTLEIGVARYNAIYGAVAQLPVTLVWLYTSWVVVLAGAEVAAVYEFGADSTPAHGGVVNRSAVALHILVCGARAFAGTGSAIRPVAVARELQLARGAVMEIIERLVQQGWLAAIEGEEPRYILATDPKRIALAPLQELNTTGAVPRACDPQVALVLQAVSDAERRVWSEWSLADVMASRPAELLQAARST